MKEQQINFNRLGNTKNPHQGKMKKVLCLCSAGLLRSPSIAWVLSNPPYNFNTRAAGVSKEYALIPLDVYLLEWADEIVCADKDHLSYVHEMLKDINISEQNKPVHCFNIPDCHRTRDPKLIKIIEAEVAKVYPQTQNKLSQ